MADFLRGYESRGQTAPFLFILSILVPGNPVVAAVMYWALDKTTQQQQQEGEGGGGGDGGGKNGTSSSCYDTFLRMLERYDMIPCV